MTQKLNNGMPLSANMDLKLNFKSYVVDVIKSTIYLVYMGKWRQDPQELENKKCPFCPLEILVYNAD